VQSRIATRKKLYSKRIGTWKGAVSTYEPDEQSSRGAKGARVQVRISVDIVCFLDGNSGFGLAEHRCIRGGREGLLLVTGSSPGSAAVWCEPFDPAA